MNALVSLYASLAHGSELQLRTAVEACLVPDVDWNVAWPVNQLLSAEAVLTDWLLPLVQSLPDLERRPYIEIPGDYQGQRWVAGTGYLVGTFSAPLWGIPATGRAMYLRYTELVRFDGDSIAQCYVIPDFLDVMHQAGVYPLRPALGNPGLILPPLTLDGMCGQDSDSGYSASSVQLVMDMLNCLRKYDGVGLESMDLESYWHSDFLWYGPGGIGTTRGIEGFRTHHQGPFLKAFADRDVDHHACTVACGDYVATGGWPHMHGTHGGGGWLGLPPTGRYLELRVMDLWRREGELLRENWVAIDIPHMLWQMGLDVFQQMKAITTGDNNLWLNSAH